MLGRWVATGVLAVALSLAIAAPGGAQEAAPPQPPKITVDADDTVHIPLYTVPASNYLSPEAKATLHDLMTHPYPPIPGGNAPFADYQKGRQILDTEVYLPMIAHAKARFAVNLESRTIAGIYIDVVTPKDGVAPKNKNRVLINLHGGGFYNGARTESLIESIPIAAVGKITVISVDYREAPEAKFPAASEDVATVYKELLKQYKPENIGIYGCSAGGGLTAQSMAWFQKEKLPRPGAIGIFCSGGISGVKGDSTYIAPAFAYAQMPPPPPSAQPNGQPKPTSGYFGDADMKDPLISPVYSPAVLAKFPPTLIITATRDTALSAAIYTHTQLVKAGVDADLHVWEGLWHGFFGDPDLPESQDAYNVIVKFFDRHLGAH